MLGLLLAVAVVGVAIPAPPGAVALAPAHDDDGHHVVVSFDPSPDPAVTGYVILRREGDELKPVKVLPRPEKTGERISYTDEVPESDTPYSYAVQAVGPLPSAAVTIGPVRAVASLFDSKRTFLLCVVIGMLLLLAYFLNRARRPGKPMYVRRIPGIDAMEEAIGRSTEMGRPVLYIPGIEEIQDIQTIAGLLILGHVAEVAARYETEIRVACMIPLVMVVAEETVRQGYYNAGKPEAHRPQNIQFISSEQFAFAAGANGIIMREKPATCIYMGRFYGESLVLAETGFVNGSIQIAGTAELTQLPFFIAACDYAIIGEELFAVSAYLSRDPRELSSLKATDMMKAAIIVLIVLGTILNTAGSWDLGRWVTPGEGAP